MKEHGVSRQLYFGILVLGLLCGSLSAESIWIGPLPVAADGSRELTITSENKGANEFVSFPLNTKKIAGRRLILSADVRTDLEHSPAAMAGAKLMINGKRADTSLFYSYSFPAETDQKSGKNAETPLDRNSGCNHERHIEQSNRRSEQQNRGHQTLSVWIQKQGQFQNSDPLSLRKTESDAGNWQVNRKYLIFPTGSSISLLDI